MMGLLRAGEGFTEEPGSKKKKKEKQGHISWDGGTEVAWRREKSCILGVLLLHTAAGKFLCFAQFSLYIPAALPDGPLSWA